jgi:hypothetical protein
MIKMLIKKMVIALIILITVTVPKVHATISNGFSYKSGEWYDDWGITRTNAEGSHGYIPSLLSETIGSNKELAYQIGQRFLDRYSDTNSRAAAILKYIQTWVEYGYDSDNVFMRGVAQDEWAWNADETAHEIDETGGQVAIGDCEDMAFFGATLYEAAGIKVAVIDAPEHCAVLIYLPDYPNANYYWDLPDDNVKGGWIWVEATGSKNPLGWTPSDFSDGEWTAWTHSGNTYDQQQPVVQSSSDTDGTSTGGFDWNTIILIVVVLFILFTKSRR